MKAMSWTFGAALAVSLFGAAVVGVSSANAGTVNGGFETGDFTGWTVTAGNGSANVVTNTTAEDGTVYNPTGGSFLASLFGGDAGIYTTISQTFNVTALGTALVGDVAFLAHDISVLGNDDGHVKIDGVTVFSEDIATVGDLGATPWTHFVFALGLGSHTIEAGVRNVGDNQLSSELALDSVFETPLPGALPLFATGAGFLYAFGLRRRRTA